MGHDHSHSGHSHAGHSHGAGKRALALVFALTAGFLAVEVVGGLLTGSLALLADAGHMASDAVSLGLALFAVWLAERPATPQRSFGYKRAEILAALANGVTLVAVSVWIFVEAFSRLQDPPPILGGWMMAVAVVGLAINVTGAFVLSRSGGESLNVEGALRHVMADLLGSVGVIAAAGVVLLTGWRYADPIISVVIGVLILGSSWKLLRESTNILLEATPKGVDAEKVGRKMASVPGVEDRKSTRLNSSHANISYAVFCLKKKKNNTPVIPTLYTIQDELSCIFFFSECHCISRQLINMHITLLNSIDANISYVFVSFSINT